MAFIPTPHGARIVVNYTKGTETFSLVFYATKAGYDLTAQQQLADAVDNVHNVTWKAQLGSQITYQSTQVYDARESDGAIVTSNAHTGPGTAATETLPINLAVCVTLRTAGRGRSSRGRKYVSGSTEGNIENGVWKGTWVASALGYITNIHNAIGDAGWQHVIRSIQQDKQPVNPAATRAVTFMSVRSSMVATQRRRVDRP